MTTQLNRFSAAMKNIVVTVVVSSVLVANVFGSTTELNKEKDTTPIKITYLGKNDKQPVFQVDIANVRGEEHWLEMKDEDGEVIYFEKFSENRFSKKFQFDIGDISSMKLSVVLINKNNDKRQHFEINNVQKLVEEVVVRKVQ